MRIGDYVTAKETNHSLGVTEGRHYKVIKITDFGNFFIINDKGKKVTPITVRFSEPV